MRFPGTLSTEAIGARVGRLRAYPAAVVALVGGFALLWAAACSPTGPAVHRVNGHALGTTWSLIVVDDDRSSTPAALEALTVAALDEVDRAASTWRDDSELARFAALAPGAAMPLSEHLRAILNEARSVHERSGGAFDPTVGPLVALYGFGAGARDTASEPSEPTEEERARAAARVDFAAVRWSADGLRRTRDDVVLDLSAIAKGHAVDVVAAHLRARGEARFLIEVGGELYLSGTRITGEPWVVGVDEPVTTPLTGPPGSAGRPVHVALSVADRAVATSGDYRAYRTDAAGRRVSHTIDPRAGRAVQNDVASVTVIAPTCMRADALATAVMVLGADAGLALLASVPDVEGLLLLHARGTDDDAIRERETPGFAAFRVSAPR